MVADSQIDVRVPIKRAAQGDACLLPAAKRDATLSDHRLIGGRELLEVRLQAARVHRSAAPIHCIAPNALLKMVFSDEARATRRGAAATQ